MTTIPKDDLARAMFAAVVGLEGPKYADELATEWAGLVEWQRDEYRAEARAAVDLLKARGCGVEIE